MDYHISFPFTDPVLIFATIMVIMLVVPLLFERLQIPTIIGLILSGVFLGPHGLGVLERNDTMILLGTIGLLYIMFVAGLEIDLNEFSKSRDRSFVFGALTFILPQGIGTLVAIYLLDFSWPAAILLASMFASHTLLTYPTVSRMGLAKRNAVTITVGGTIITDTAALLVLAVIAGATVGDLTMTFWLILGISLTIYTFLMFWGIPKIGRWFFRVSNGGGVPEFLFVLAVVFIAAFFAELAGVEHIIGAFIAGLTLNRLIPEHSALMNRLEFVGNALFIPFFLISVGMLVDLRVLFNGLEAWLVSITMVATVSVTKYLAALFTQKLFGYSRDERNLIFGLSVPQAAATLAAVLIGYEIGLFGDDVLNGTIMMILVTCFVGSYFTEKAVRNIVLAQGENVLEKADTPQRIVVPIANPATIGALINVATLIRDAHSQEPVRALSVLSESPNVEAQLVQNEKKLALATKEAAAAAVPVRIVNRLDMSPAQGIIRAMTELRATHLVIGWNGKITTQDRIFGSILDRVIGSSKQLVLVCKLEHPLHTMQRILLVLPPNAEHEPGFLTLAHTVKHLAQQMGVKIWVISATKGASALSRLVEETTPTVDVKYETYQDLAEVSNYRDNITADDLVVLMSARRGMISWQPLLDGLPRELAQSLPQQSFIITY
ncbi:MAG: cation:proton antiporter, partial [Anaerolinea sp.]|nr:cation:proton antiporter [Anaerolinea sp.]